MSSFIKMENNTSVLILNELAQAKDLLKQLESENSLSMLSEIKSEAAGNQSLVTGSEAASTTLTDSPHSVNGSPNKKRKRVPRWTQQIRACEKTGLEGPFDDGHSWRKYGQNYILGATYPRGYYRCAHRHAQGCLARKYVQRSDEDPSIFRVTYRGRHTCIIRAPNLQPAGTSQNIGGQQDQKPTSGTDSSSSYGVNSLEGRQNLQTSY